jgi:hypothetical protein
MSAIDRRREIAGRPAPRRAHRRIRIVSCPRGGPGLDQQGADERGGERRADRKAVESCAPALRGLCGRMNTTPALPSIDGAARDRIRCQREFALGCP